MKKVNLKQFNYDHIWRMCPAFTIQCRVRGSDYLNPNKKIFSINTTLDGIYKTIVNAYFKGNL
jgi:hypothetical protein